MISRILKLSILGLVLISTAVFAEVCPSSQTLEYGKYTPPTGWHVTALEVPAELNKVAAFSTGFYVASYNFDESHHGPNGNAVSCNYGGVDQQDNLVVVEIATNQGNLPPPVVSSATDWKKISTDSYLCGSLAGGNTPARCPFSLSK